MNFFPVLRKSFYVATTAAVAFGALSPAARSQVLPQEYLINVQGVIEDICASQLGCIGGVAVFSKDMSGAFIGSRGFKQVFEGSMALGDAKVLSKQSIAIGYKAIAGESTITGNKLIGSPDSIAIGANANAGGDSFGAIALGKDAESTSRATIALGYNAQAKEQAGIAIGGTSASGADYAIAIGENSKAITESSIVIGREARTLSGRRAIAIGELSFANGDDSITIGADSAVKNGGTDAIAIGARSQVGSDANVTVSYGIALGSEARVKQDAGIAIGVGSISDGRDSIALGPVSRATAKTGIAIGQSSVVTGESGVSIGLGSIVDGQDGIAIGLKNRANAGQGIVIGISSTATGKNAYAIGGAAVADGVNVVAIGSQATALGYSTNAYAVGTKAYADGTDVIAFGTGARATGVGSTALGVGAVTTRDNQMVLGRSSTQVTIPNLSGSGEEMVYVTSDGTLQRSSISLNTIPKLESAVEGLGQAVESAGAISSAMSAVPQVSMLEDEPVRCGFGTGGWGSQYAVSAGCALRVADRVHFNGALAYTPSINYEYGSTPSVAGRLGFSFPLGRISKKPSTQSTASEALLKSRIDQMEKEKLLQDEKINQYQSEISSLKGQLAMVLKRLGLTSNTAER